MVKKSKAKRSGNGGRRGVATLESRKAGSAPLLEKMHFKKTKDDDDASVVDMKSSKEPVPSSKTKDNESGHDRKGIPRSFVVKSGKINKNLKDLVADMRKVMSPYTALSLRDSSKASLKDYVAVCGHMNVSHIIAISETKVCPTLKVTRAPSGPTLTFRIEKYSLISNIREKLKSSRRSFIDPSGSFEFSPLVVLNNFEHLGEMDLSKTEDVVLSKEKEENLLNFARSKALSLCALTFQNMFPKINIRTININHCKRILLFNYNKEKDEVEMRHYLIRIRPKGVSRVMKKLVKTNGELNFGDINDIGDLFDGTEGMEKITGDAYITSDSEFDERNQIKIASKKLKGVGPQLGTVKNPLDRKILNKMDTLQKETGVKKTEVNSVQLREIGPRLNLTLVKLEAGIFKGEVKYHSFVAKSEEEIMELQTRKRKEVEEKEERKKVQEENVERKRVKIEAKKEKKKARKKKFLAKKENNEVESDQESGDEGEERAESEEMSEVE